MTIKQMREWTEDEMKTLAIRALAGDKTVVNDLIDAYIPTALRSAAWYVRKAPSKLDDVFAAGMEGLVIACQRACDGHMKDLNVEMYIKSIVRWRVQDFLRGDFLIPIPQKEFKKRIALMDDFEPIKDGETLKKHEGGVLTGVAVFVSLDNLRDNYSLDIPYNDSALNEVTDLFEKFGFTERETDVVSLRMQDYTMQEIADTLGFSKPYIKQVIDGIKAKMLAAGCKEPTAKISGTKVCTKCGTEKSLSDFYKRSDSGIETHKSKCKECMKGERDGVHILQQPVC